MKFLLALAILISFSLQALADKSIFGVEPGSLEWQKAELEEWLGARSTKDLSAFLKPEEFRIQVSVTFERPVKGAKQIPLTNVNVPLLGTVATFNNNPPKDKNEKKNLFEKVSKVDVTVIVSDRVSEAGANSIGRIVKQSFSVIPQDRVIVQTIRLESPSLGLAGWVREFKLVIGLLGAFALFILGLRYILPRIRFQTAIKFGPAHAPVSKSEAMPFGKLQVPLMVPMEVFTPDDSNKSENNMPPMSSTVGSSGEELLDSLLPQTLAAVELRRLRSAAMTLSIADCVQLIARDPQLGSILVSILPVEKTTSILGQLSASDLELLKEKTLEWTSDSVARDAAELMSAIQSFKGFSEPTPNERLRVFVDQIGPENEAKIYEDLVRMEKFDQLAAQCREIPPAELIVDFPTEILFAAFERMGMKEKAAVLSCVNRDLAERLSPRRSREPMNLALRQEVEKISSNPQLAEKAKAAWPLFLNLVREAVQKNPNWRQTIKPLVENWLWDKSQGVVGKQSPASKGKLRNDVA